MKLIVQGQTLSLEGDDGQIVKLPSRTKIEHDISDLGDHDFHSSRVVVTLTVDLQDIIHRPENAVEAKQTSIALGEARGTHHAEHLLVFQPPPFDVNRTTRLRLNGWTCTGGIQIKGELEPTVPFVWVFRRTVEGPPPELLKLTRDERARLFRGIWTPNDINALNHDLVRAFAPCLLGYRYVGESVTEVRGFGPDSAPFTSPDQLIPGETVPC